MSTETTAREWGIKFPDDGGIDWGYTEGQAHAEVAEAKRMVEQRGFDWRAYEGAQLFTRIVLSVFSDPEEIPFSAEIAAAYGDGM